MILVYPSNYDEGRRSLSTLVDPVSFVHIVKCASPLGKAELIQTIGRSLNFPEGTGSNWDALFDRLTDLSWLEEGSHAIAFEDAGVLLEIGNAFGVFARVLQDALDEDFSDNDGRVLSGVVFLPKCAKDADRIQESLKSYNVLVS